MIGWYWGEVRGNLLAVVPCGIVAYFWLRAKHRALTEAHRAHNEKLSQILEHLDPDAQTDGLLDLIADRTDHSTPGGVGEVYKAIHSSAGARAASSP